MSIISIDVSQSGIWQWDDETGLLTPPSGVTEIPTLFKNTKNSELITKLVISDQIREIGNSSLYGLKNLKEIQIPSSVTTIKANALSGSGITKLFIPDTVTTLGTSWFNMFGGTTAGPADDGNEYDLTLGWKNTIPNNAFYGMKNLKSIIIPDGVYTIDGDNVFAACDGLEYVRIPASVRSMNGYLLQGKLTSIGPVGSGCSIEYAGNSGDVLYNIITYRMSGKILKLIIPGTFTTLGNNWVAVGLSTLKTAGPIGGGYDYEFGWDTQIPARAFSNSDLTSVRLPRTITTIGQRAFSSISTLKELCLSKSLKTFDGQDVFNGCNNLTIYYEGTEMEWQAITNSTYAEGQVKDVIYEANLDAIEAQEKIDELTENLNQAMQDYQDLLQSESDNAEEIEGALDDIRNAKQVLEDMLERYEDIPELNREDADAAIRAANDIISKNDVTLDESPMAVTPKMLYLLVSQVLTSVNSRLAARIVNEITDEADENHIPSALAVLNYLRTLAPNFTFETVMGKMETITEPSSQVIYLQKDDEDDQTWTLYLWVDGKWVAIGDTSIDLVNYWSKSEDDIAELREKLFGEDGRDVVLESLDLTGVLKDDEESKEIVLGWLETAKDTVISWIREAGIEDLLSDEQMGDIADKILETDGFKETISEKVLESEAFSEKVVEEGEKVFVRKDDLKANLSVITPSQIAAVVAAANDIVGD